jgi:hypothetical protein
LDSAIVVIPSAPELARSSDDLTDGVQHSRIGFVEQLGAYVGVPVDAEHQLGQIVTADRHPVDTHADVSGRPVRM